jgi:hypothetical protein
MHEHGGQNRNPTMTGENAGGNDDPFHYERIAFHQLADKNKNVYRDKKNRNDRKPPWSSRCIR